MNKVKELLESMGLKNPTYAQIDELRRAFEYEERKNDVRFSIEHLNIELTQEEEKEACDKIYEYDYSDYNNYIIDVVKTIIERRTEDVS